MLYNIKQNRILLFEDVLSEIEYVKPNYFKVRNIKNNIEHELNKSDISLKTQPAPMYTTCPEEFGFNLLNSTQIKEYFKEYSDLFSHSSLYYKDDNEVFCIDSNSGFYMLYKGTLSEEIKYVHEFQDKYFTMFGKEVVFKRKLESDFSSL